MFIGTNAGYNSSGSVRSMFIGANAGFNSNFSYSVGIGENALRGGSLSSTIETGSGNIEIVTPYNHSSHFDERLFTNTTSESHRLNIGNVFAGDMWQKRMSIGQAALSPTSVLDVNHAPGANGTHDGHSSLDHIQKWNSDGVAQAAVSTHRCSGFMEVDPYGGNTLRPLFVEGVVNHGSIAGGTVSEATSGRMSIYRGTSPEFALTDTGEDVYVVSRDGSTISNGAYVVAARVGCEYRPIFVGCP